uniref:Uncharacterized protein n=1 Tax=Arundo donax TaxID=35708 RepID=A0A0A9H6W5_ARUDO
MAPIKFSSSLQRNAPQIQSILLVAEAGRGKRLGSRLGSRTTDFTSVSQPFGERRFLFLLGRFVPILSISGCISTFLIFRVCSRRPTYLHVKLNFLATCMMLSMSKS